MSILFSPMMQLGWIGGAELIIIIIIFIALILGSKKIPELARSIGKAATEYEKTQVQVRRKLEEIADTWGIDHSNKRNYELKMAIDSERKIRNLSGLH